MRYSSYEWRIFLIPIPQSRFMYYPERHLSLLNDYSAVLRAY